MLDATFIGHPEYTGACDYLCHMMAIKELLQQLKE